MKSLLKKVTLVLVLVMVLADGLSARATSIPRLYLKPSHGQSSAS